MFSKEVKFFVASVLILIFLSRNPIDSAGSAIMGGSEWTKWDSILKKYSAQYRVPWKWLKVIILNESNNGRAPSVLRGLANPSDVEASKSSDGKSWGLMQITLPTAKGLLKRDVTAAELNNPDFSVMLSAMLVRELVNQFGLDFQKVMRAYNGGPKAVQLGTTNFLLTTPYYTKSLANLGVVMASHGGTELEIG